MPPALSVPAGPPREIVHSPLLRTAQTAEAVAAAASAPGAFDSPIALRADPGVMEVAQGEWEGRPATEIVERWGDLLDAWHRRPTEAWAPGGESLVEVQARASGSLRALLRKLVDGERRQTAAPSTLVGGARLTDGPWSILVSHDGLFKVALLTLFDLPLERFWAFSFSLCGLSVVELVDGEPRLRAHNLTDHLAPLLEEAAQEISEEREQLGAL